MVTSGLPLSPQVDGFGLYCPVGCADSHTSLNTPKERVLILIVVEKYSVHLLCKILICKRTSNYICQIN